MEISLHGSRDTKLELSLEDLTILSVEAFEKITNGAPKLSTMEISSSDNVTVACPSGIFLDLTISRLEFQFDSSNSLPNSYIHFCDGIEYINDVGAALVKQNSKA